jgi:hypothetical protein
MGRPFYGMNAGKSDLTGVISIVLPGCWFLWRDEVVPWDYFRFNTQTAFSRLLTRV